jgi:hypothetical protein
MCRATLLLLALVGLLVGITLESISQMEISPRGKNKEKKRHSALRWPPIDVRKHKNQSEVG